MRDLAVLGLGAQARDGGWSSSGFPPLAFFRYDLAPYGETGLVRIAALLRARGARIAGVLGRDALSPDGRRREARLEDLATEHSASISARPDRLDAAALALATMWIADALREGAEVLIVGHFGREEAEGRGLFPVIADAFLRGVPTLLGLSRPNSAHARRALGEAMREFVSDSAALEWLERELAAGVP